MYVPNNAAHVNIQPDAQTIVEPVRPAGIFATVAPTLLGRGLALIPVGDDKKPFFPGFQHWKYCPGKTAIDKMAVRYRDANVAILCGLSGVVVVDFSSPTGLRSVAALCAERGASLVSGTTGLAPDDEAVIAAAARRVPVLRAANFSLGVAALQRALDAALAALPASWDVEIIERHHRRKADSPSGTALALARAVQERRGAQAALRLGRSGLTGERPAGEIGMHSVRGGTWVGDHSVLLAGDGEWIELRHVAEDRAAFASGALAAARFVAQAKPGLYTLGDLLGGR